MRKHVLKKHQRLSYSKRYSLKILLAKYESLLSMKVQGFVGRLIAKQLFCPPRQARLKSNAADLLELQPFAGWFELLPALPIHQISEENKTQATTPSKCIGRSRSFNPSVCLEMIHSASRILCPVLRSLRKIRVPQTLQVIDGCHLPSRSRVKLCIVPQLAHL